MNPSVREPRDVSVGLDDDPLVGPDLIRRATWAFVGLGLVLRVVTYAMRFPLWGDEAFVAANFISRGYRDLLQPLDYGQVCPLLFLWGELAVVKLFGFNEWSLRLVPTAASIASVFLFAHIAGRIFRGVPRLLAVAIFAVSFYPIRHGAEVKPYSTDLLAALVLLALATEWWRQPGRVRWLWGMVFFAPLAIALSNPAIFVAGAVSLALVVPAWKLRRQGAFLPFVLYNLALMAAFGVLFVCFTRGQMQAVAETLRSNYWAANFPPLGRPLELIVWLIDAHTGRMLAHPFGGERGASSLTTYLVVVGLVRLARWRERSLLVLLLAPFGLALMASILGRYPYGGSARTMLFVAPAICLLAGLGASRVMACLPALRFRRRVFRGSLIVLAGAGTVLLALTVAFPYKSRTDEESRRFARWFWSDQSRDAELVCLKEDLNVVLNPSHWRLFRSALYLCNQRIYSPRHHCYLAADLGTISASRPLRCVLYNKEPDGRSALASWLDGMSARYVLQRRQTFVINESDAPAGRNDEDRYDVYDFAPREIATGRERRIEVISERGIRDRK